MLLLLLMSISPPKNITLQQSLHSLELTDISMLVPSASMRQTEKGWRSLNPILQSAFRPYANHLRSQKPANSPGRKRRKTWKRIAEGVSGVSAMIYSFVDYSTEDFFSNFTNDEVESDKKTRLAITFLGGSGLLFDAIFRSHFRTQTQEIRPDLRLAFNVQQRELSIAARLRF